MERTTPPSSTLQKHLTTILTHIYTYAPFVAYNKLYNRYEDVFPSISYIQYVAAMSMSHTIIVYTMLIIMLCVCECAMCMMGF